MNHLVSYAILTRPNKAETAIMAANLVAHQRPGVATIDALVCILWLQLTIIISSFNKENLVVNINKFVFVLVLSLFERLVGKAKENFEHLALVFIWKLVCTCEILLLYTQSKKPALGGKR